MSELDEGYDGEGEEVTEEIDEVKVAFDEAVSGGAAEDGVKMAMIQAGATFKSVTRLYNQYLIDSGMAMSKKDKDAILDKVLAGSDLATEEGLTAAIANVVVEVTGVTDKSASMLVRAWAKKNEVEIYKRPKGEGGGQPKFASQYYDYLRANAKSTVEAATAFIMGTDGNEATSDNVKNHLKHYLTIHSLVSDIANS